MKIKKQVLVLFSHAGDVEPFARFGINRYVQKVLQRTNGEFELVVDYATTDAQFETMSDGSVVFVKPAQIGVEGHKVELANKKEYDTVCLIYDPAFIIGPMPTNPVENPIIIEGFNPIQIPTTWIGTVPHSSVFDWDGSNFSAQLFFAHENSHSDFQIINTEKGLSLHDKTHDLHDNHTAMTADDDPSDYFIDLLLELKPYWDALGTPDEPQGVDQMLAFEHAGTIYVAVFAKFVPIGDSNTFLELGGNWNYVKKLTDAEFNSIVVPYLAKVTILA